MSVFLETKFKVFKKEIKGQILNICSLTKTFIFGRQTNKEKRGF